MIDTDYLDYISEETADPWYFREGAAKVISRFPRGGKIPRGFHGPYETRREAIEAYREWLLGKMECERE